MDPSTQELIKQFGSIGLFITFLIWEHRGCREDRRHFMEFIERQAERHQLTVQGIQGIQGERGPPGERGLSGE